MLRDSFWLGQVGALIAFMGYLLGIYTFVCSFLFSCCYLFKHVWILFLFPLLSLSLSLFLLYISPLFFFFSLLPFLLLLLLSLSLSTGGSIQHYLIACSAKNNQLTVDGKAYFSSLPELIQVMNYTTVSLCVPLLKHSFTNYRPI